MKNNCEKGIVADKGEDRNLGKWSLTLSKCNAIP